MQPEHLPNRYGTQDVTGVGKKPNTGSFSSQFSGLRVTSLTAEQHKNTCGYWYVVTSASTPHTAFADRDHLIKWMESLGLSLLGELSMAGTQSTVDIHGTYLRTSHLSYDAFYSLDGKRVRVCDNSDYTLGIITEDDNGISELHHLNCNLRDRLVFDYSASRALVG